MAKPIRHLRGLARRHPRRVLFVAFLVHWLARLPFLLQRKLPVVQGDEFNYLWKALNLVLYGSYFAPTPDLDAPNHGAPLVSLLFSLGHLVPDPELGYRITLAISALATSAIVFPAFRIARTVFRRHHLLIALMASVSGVAWTHSFAAKSEGPYLLLVMEVFAAYCVYWQRPGVSTALRLSMLATLLPLLRYQGLGILGALAIAGALSTTSGRLRLASARDLARSCILWAPGVSAYLCWLTYLGRHRYASLESPGHLPQTVANYLLQVLDSGVPLLHACEVAMGKLMAQTAYVNLATGNLTVLAAVVWLFSPSPESGPAESTVRSASSLRPVPALLLFCAATIVTSTVYIYVVWATGATAARYDMYGRYVDPVVPLASLLALGYLVNLRTFRPTRPAALVLALTLFTAYLVLPTSIETPHFLNPGALWYSTLGFSGPLVPSLVGLAMGLLIWRLSPIRRRIAITLVNCTIALLSGHAATMALSSEEARLEEVARPLRALRPKAARIFITEDNSPQVRYIARFLLPRRIGDPSGIEGTPSTSHYVLHRDATWPQREFVVRSRRRIFDLFDLVDLAQLTGQAVAETPWGLKIVKGATRSSILTLPRSSLRFELQLPRRCKARLLTSLRFHPVSMGWGSDGVIARIAVRAEGTIPLARTIRLGPEEARQLTLGLEGFQGRRIELTLEALNEDGMNEVGDWLLWEDPAIESVTDCAELPLANLARESLH